MPTYCYRCKNCNIVLEFRHSYKERKTDCTECKMPTLSKLLSTPINILAKNHPSEEKAGSVVRATIQKVKDEIKQEKKVLKKRKK